jgi:hypothetical protein
VRQLLDTFGDVDFGGPACIRTSEGFSGPKAKLCRTLATSGVGGISDGCQVGWPSDAFELVSDHGVPTGGVDGGIPYFGSGDGKNLFDVQGESPPCPDECQIGYKRPLTQDLFSFSFLARGGANSYETSSSVNEFIKETMMTEGPVAGAVHVGKRLLRVQVWGL